LQGGSAFLYRSAPMARTKKSIKNRSKTKKQALKRKRTRRNKSLRRGMRAR
jgi:predicted transcriptional regulator